VESLDEGNSSPVTLRLDRLGEGKANKAGTVTDGLPLAGTRRAPDGQAKERQQTCPPGHTGTHSGRAGRGTSGLPKKRTRLIGSVTLDLLYSPLHLGVPLMFHHDPSHQAPSQAGDLFFGIGRCSAPPSLGSRDVVSQRQGGAWRRGFGSC